MSTLSKIPRLLLGLETIDFQNDGTGKKLEKHVQAIMDKYDSGVFRDEAKADTSEEFKAIEDIIFRRFGLKTDMHVGYNGSAAIYIYSVNRFNILDQAVNHGVWDKDIEKHLSKIPVIKGTVNIKTARVSGIFSEFPSRIDVDFPSMMADGLDVEEIVATIFHEVGHAFNVCEFSDRVETSNQILANCIRVVLNREEKADAKYLYRELKKIDADVTEKDVEDLVGDQRIIAGYNWMRYLVKFMNSQMSMNHGAAYDISAAEAMSDNFVSRMGYGRALLTGLDKSAKRGERGLSYPNVQNTQLAYLTSIIMFCYLSAVIVSSFILGPIGIIFSSIFGMLTFGIIKSSGVSNKDFTYDDIRVRYKRIREDAIQHLKKEKIDKLIALKVIADIKIFDNIINQLGEEKSFFTDLSRLIFKKDQQVTETIAAQRLLEELSSNDFFLKSAELTHFK